MNIELRRNLEDYVSDLVHSSGYKGVEEVVSEALREHQLRRQGVSVTMTPELERLLDGAWKAWNTLKRRMNSVVNEACRRAPCIHPAT